MATVAKPGLGRESCGSYLRAYHVKCYSRRLNSWGDSSDRPHDKTLAKATPNAQAFISIPDDFCSSKINQFVSYVSASCSTLLRASRLG